MQGGQDILSMMGQLMKPKKTEITGETRRSAGPEAGGVRGPAPPDSRGRAGSACASREGDRRPRVRPACSALPARPGGPGLPPWVRPQAGCPFWASD